MAGISIDDEELEHMVYQHVREKMIAAASATISHQAKDIVAAELARLRLTDPNAKPLEQIIGDQLEALIDQRLSIILKPMVREEMRKAFQDLSTY